MLIAIIALFSLNWEAVSGLQFSVGFSLLLAASRTNFRVTSVSTLVNLSKPPKDDAESQPRKDQTKTSFKEVSFKAILSIIDTSDGFKSSLSTDNVASVVSSAC